MNIQTGQPIPQNQWKSKNLIYIVRCSINICVEKEYATLAIKPFIS